MANKKIKDNPPAAKPGGRAGTTQPNQVYPSIGGAKFKTKRHVKRG